MKREGKKRVCDIWRQRFKAEDRLILIGECQTQTTRRDNETKTKTLFPSRQMQKTIIFWQEQCFFLRKKGENKDFTRTCNVIELMFTLNALEVKMNNALLKI